MIELLKKAVDLLLRFLDWRREGKRAREREEVRKAVVNHDREAMNRIIQERRRK